MSLDWLAVDAVNTFISDFAECIQYIPYEAAPINLQAIVTRNPASAMPGLSGTGVYQHEITIANDLTAGRTVINTGGDQVVFANKIGGKPETFIVSVVLHNDQGVFVLGCG